MSILLNGDCLELLQDVGDKSVDLIFCDLPYGCTSCKWDCKIDLSKLWSEILRVKKLHTPIFMTTTTKFGVELINSSPKSCPFRYDLVWVKSSPAGFLSAKKMPMRKHEMVYVFYEKLPFYDLSSHTHKFIKEGKKSEGDKGNECYGKFSYYNNGEKGYDPPLPVSVVKEEKTQISKPQEKDLYGASNGGTVGNVHGTNYEPPLPSSVVKQEAAYYMKDGKTIYNGGKAMGIFNKGGTAYEPPLPTSVNKINDGQIYNGGKGMKVHSDGKGPQYDPPLPTSVGGMDCGQCWDCSENPDCPALRDELLYRLFHPDIDDDYINEDDIPNSILNIKSEKGKHSTQKPVDLMKWVLKYYSKKNDVVLDNCMGSGSTGVACVEMDRQFIGIEMNEDIFEVACDRIL